MNKTILIAILAMICCQHSYAQATDFADMNKKEKDEYMTCLAMEVAQNFGPDYCKGPLTAKIVKPVACDTKSNLNFEIARHHGRKYYTVELRYAHRTVPIYVYAAKVHIWADTGEPAGVFFGNGHGVHFMQTSYKDWLKRGIKQEERAKYRRPDFDFYESLSPEDLKEMNDSYEKEKKRHRSKK